MEGMSGEGFVEANVQGCQAAGWRKLASSMGCHSTLLEDLAQQIEMTYITVLLIALFHLTGVEAKGSNFFLGGCSF